MIFGPGLAAFWLGTILLPEPFIYWAWVLLFAVETGIIVRGLPTVHHEGMHLVERAGLFVLILLGDSIVELIVAVDIDGPPLGWVIASAAFVMSCLFWASYFSLGRRVPNLQERVATGATGRLVRDIVVFGHFLLVLGLLMLAAGFRTAIEFADAEQAPSAVVVGVAGGSLLYFLAQTLMAIRCGFPPAWVAAWMFPSVAIAGLVVALGTAWPALAVVLVSLAATIVHLVMGEVLAATSKL